MHPLTPDLSQLKDDELHKKIYELTQRLTQSYRFGNYEIVGQIHMVLEDYTEESNRRQRKVLEELAQKNNKFDGIIDIK
jgi:hypothetical protein